MREQTFLSNYRVQNQLTQLQLAKEMGITAATLGRIERNIGYETVRLILNWCKANQISPDKIFPPESAA